MHNMNSLGFATSCQLAVCISEPKAKESCKKQSTLSTHHVSPCFTMRSFLSRMGPRSNKRLEDLDRRLQAQLPMEIQMPPRLGQLLTTSSYQKDRPRLLGDLPLTSVFFSSKFQELRSHCHDHQKSSGFFWGKKDLETRNPDHIIFPFTDCGVEVPTAA